MHRSTRGTCDTTRLGQRYTCQRVSSLCVTVMRCCIVHTRCPVCLSVILSLLGRCQCCVPFVLHFTFLLSVFIAVWFRVLTYWLAGYWRNATMHPSTLVRLLTDFEIVPTIVSAKETSEVLRLSIPRPYMFLTLAFLVVRIDRRACLSVTALVTYTTKPCSSLCSHSSSSSRCSSE